MVKPFAVEELLARLRAISRLRPDTAGRLRVGDLVLDPDQQRAWRGENELDLARVHGGGDQHRLPGDRHTEVLQEQRAADRRVPPAVADGPALSLR
ncbi:hypothetical protein [Streptomyces mirabilis]